MTPNGSFLFLIVVIVTWLLMMLTTFSGLLCKQTSGGVWSSIVIDDCFGSYWIPTMSLTGHDGQVGTLQRASLRTLRGLD